MSQGICKVYHTLVVQYYFYSDVIECLPAIQGIRIRNRAKIFKSPRRLQIFHLKSFMFDAVK